MQPLDANTEQKTAARYRTLLIIWFAILITVGVFFLLTLFLPRQPNMEENNILILALTAAGTLLAIASIVPKQKMLQQSVEQQKPQLVQSGYIIAWAMSEAAALFGMVLYLATPDRYYFLMFVVAAVFMLVHFPRRAHLLAAEFKHL